jgi:hypothetical protein
VISCACLAACKIEHEPDRHVATSGGRRNAGGSTSIAGDAGIGAWTGDGGIATDAGGAAGFAGTTGAAGLAGSAGIPNLPVHVCSSSVLDATAVTSFYQAAQCLFVGPDAPQKGVATGLIDPERVAIVRGRVLDSSNTPISGVRVAVQGHGEFGDTVTDSLGAYALAINGGQGITLLFEKPGRLSVQRQRRVDWQRFAAFPDVVLLAENTASTAIDLATATTPTLAMGTETKDASGTRTQAVLVRPATKVTLDLPGGTKRELTEFHLRSTEYTVGTAGPSAMPGDLPNTSGYTYAAEFSLDEARAVGATRVSFDPPVVSYVDNFLRFPAGTTVPAGYYDAERAVWVPGESGVVLTLTLPAMALPMTSPS